MKILEIKDTVIETVQFSSVDLTQKEHDIHQKLGSKQRNEECWKLNK